MEKEMKDRIEGAVNRRADGCFALAEAIAKINFAIIGVQVDYMRRFWSSFSQKPKKSA
jgi:hypothetical protein